MAMLIKLWFGFVKTLTAGELLLLLLFNVCLHSLPQALSMRIQEPRLQLPTI
jgi:hypothetical protein